MLNPYFRFKQFIVYQDTSAMKVCTDACVFGAYIASKEKDFGNDETNILDIGTGTGLLSLMIAQKVKGNIDAVEIDHKAFEQTKENFEMSAWKSRLSAYHADITKFQFHKKYGLIVSNPPFFENSLKGSDLHKNLAKHSTSLPCTEVASITSANLFEKGKFYILLPYKEFEPFEKTAAKNNLLLIKKLNVRHYEDSNYSRTIGVFSKVKSRTVTEETLTIKDNNDTYTQAFTQLLKDYYLYL